MGVGQVVQDATCPIWQVKQRWAGSISIVHKFIFSKNSFTMAQKIFAPFFVKEVF
jgi:hypothetical protein